MDCLSYIPSYDLDRSFFAHDEYRYDFSYQGLHHFKDLMAYHHQAVYPIAAFPDTGYNTKHITSAPRRQDSVFSLASHRLGCASSTYTNSSLDDRQRSPSASDLAATSPERFSDIELNSADDLLMMGSETIAMPIVQAFEDAPVDSHAMDDGIEFFAGPYAQEGYHPISASAVDQLAYEHTASGLAMQSPAAATTNAVESPGFRSRRPAARALEHRPRGYRVSKRNIKRVATFSTAVNSDSDDDASSTTTRAFHCPLAPYGCESTFGSKNEWKRHFSTQHLRLEYWRCDQCPAQGRKPNDFNRRDLFTQHVRRMHANAATSTHRGRRSKNTKSDAVEHEISVAATRCYRRLRSPPANSICVICEQQFSGKGSWEERMEHIGKHFESAKRDQSETNAARLDVASWHTDVAVERWMVAEGILTPGLSLGSCAEDTRD